jgi:HEAT repeat protein
LLSDRFSNNTVFTMTHTHRPEFILLSLAAALVLSQTGYCQDAAAPKAVPAAKAADKAAAPIAAPPAPVVLPGPTDPAVQTILDAKPKTPPELMQAILSLLELDRVDIAKPLLQQLVNAKPDPAASADLIHRFGSATFLQLANDPRLKPDGLLLSQQVLRAAAAAARDPARLAAAVKQLGAPSPDAQRDALATLHDGGPYSAAPLLAALADPVQASIHPLARGALMMLGSEAIKPLSAAVADGDPARAVQAIDALAAIGNKESAIYLLAPYFGAGNSQVREAAGEAIRQLLGSTPSRADAVELLARETRSSLAGQRVLRPDDGDNVAIWNWGSPQGFTVAGYPPARAAMFVALRLAGDWLVLEPDSHEARRLYLVSLLESGVYRVGLDAPLPTGPGSEYERAAKFGVDAINDSLAHALATGHTAAARAAARVLQGVGSASLLTRDGAKPCPLVLALRSDERRVRHAAAEAILSFTPTAPFAGSSYLTDAVAELATSTGRRRAVIGFPTTPTAQQLAGLAAASGYEPATANDNFGVFAAATQSADTELVLISSRIGRPDAFDLIQQLRGDPRTAQLPIGVMAELDDFQLQTKRFAPEPNVFVVYRPENPAEMATAVAKAVALSGDHIIPPMLRLQEAAVALDWLAEMAKAPPQVFDVRRYESVIEHALYHPLLAPHAAAAMARLGTHSSQVALVDLASLPVQPLDVRQAAAVAFAESVQHFGLRLAPSEVIRQYDRYNQSAQLDKATQELLGRILDTIESPTKKDKPPAAAARQPH